MTSPLVTGLRGVMRLREAANLARACAAAAPGFFPDTL